MNRNTDAIGIRQQIRALTLSARLDKENSTPYARGIWNRLNDLVDKLLDTNGHPSIKGANGVTLYSGDRVEYSNLGQGILTCIGPNQWIFSYYFTQNTASQTGRFKGQCWKHINLKPGHDNHLIKDLPEAI